MPCRRRGHLSLGAAHAAGRRLASRLRRCGRDRVLRCGLACGGGVPCGRLPAHLGGLGLCSLSLFALGRRGGRRARLLDAFAQVHHERAAHARLDPRVGVVRDAQAAAPQLGDGSGDAGLLGVEGLLAGLGLRSRGRLALLGFLAGAFLGLAGGTLGLLARPALGLLAGKPLGLLTLTRLAGLLLGKTLSLKLGLSLSLGLRLLGLLLATGLTGLGGLGGGLHAGPLCLSALGLLRALCLLACRLGRLRLGFVAGLLGLCRLLERLGKLGVAQHREQDAALLEDLDARRALEVPGLHHGPERLEAHVLGLHVVRLEGFLAALYGNLLAKAQLLAQQAIEVQSVSRCH